MGQIWADHGLATPLYEDTRSRCGQAEAGWGVSGYNERSLHEVPKMKLREILDGSSIMGRPWQVGLSFDVILLILVNKREDSARK